MSSIVYHPSMLSLKRLMDLWLICGIPRHPLGIFVLREIWQAEIEEWASLSHELTLVNLNETFRYFAPSLGKNGVFPTNPSQNPYHQWVIWAVKIYMYPFWKGNIPKRWNCFFGLNVHCKLQRSSPRINLSPNCCIMCKNDGESHIHLFFQYHYAKTFWDFVHQEFRWANVFPQDVQPILHFIFNGHLFNKDWYYSWTSLGPYFGQHGWSVILVSSHFGQHGWSLILVSSQIRNRYPILSYMITSTICSSWLVKIESSL